MESNTLTKGNLWKQIFVFSLPLIFSNLLQVLFNMSDIAVVGRFAGPEALGSVGSTTTIVALFTGFLIGMGSGMNVISAHALGAKDTKAIKETTHSSFVLAIAFGIIILVSGFISSYALLKLLNTKDILIDGAALYLHIYFLGMPAMAIYNYGNATYSAAGNTKKPLLYLSISGVLNICLNLFFVIVLKMSVAGVALATIISQYTTAIMIIAALRKERADFALTMEFSYVNKGRIISILKLAIPSGIQYAIFQIANSLILASVNSFDAVVVEGNSAATNADNLVYDVMAAFYTACSSFIGQNYGAKNKKRILASYGITTLYSFGIGLVMGVSLVLFGTKFLQIFTNDPGVIAAGMERLVIMGFSYAFSSFMDNTTAACRGIGKSIVPVSILIFGSCIFRVIWVYTVFAYFHTITSLYLLYIFSWSITALLEMAYFYYCYRKEIAVMA